VSFNIKVKEMKMTTILFYQSSHEYDDEL